MVYPCAGLLAEGRPTAPGALRRLIGPARATLLSLLDNPMSTTQLVSVTGFAIGAVGNHLKILLDAQLVRRRRAGRSVLYYRTPDGDRLIRATTDNHRTAPMAGMNAEEKEDMVRFILDINDQRGTTVVMIEHDMGVVMELSQRVCVLDFGRKIADGTPEEVRRDPQVQVAYLGPDARQSA